MCIRDDAVMEPLLEGIQEALRPASHPKRGSWKGVQRRSGASKGGGIRVGGIYTFQMPKLQSSDRESRSRKLTPTSPVPANPMAQRLLQRAGCAMQGVLSTSKRTDEVPRKGGWMGGKFCPPSHLPALM